MHSALKLEKSAISKVQKSIICIFKNGKKINFCIRKIFKITKNAIFGLKKTGFLVVLNFFLVLKLFFFAIFEIVKNVFLYFWNREIALSLTCSISFQFNSNDAKIWGSNSSSAFVWLFVYRCLKFELKNIVKLKITKK